MEKAVILCGGKGIRLRPLTESVPKPLVKLNGKPILEYLMNFLSDQGINEFVICTGYEAKMVEETVREFAKSEWKINFVDSGEHADIMKRIWDASEFCGNDFFVCYGDTIADVPLSEVIKIHEENDSLITNVLYQMQSPFGLMETEENLVKEFKEKPLLPFWFNIGFFIMDKKALQYAKGINWIDFLEKMISMKKMYAYKHFGNHITFNTEKEKKEAEKRISVFRHILQ